MTEPTGAPDQPRPELPLDGNSAAALLTDSVISLVLGATLTLGSVLTSNDRSYIQGTVSSALVSLDTALKGLRGVRLSLEPRDSVRPDVH